MVDEAIEPDEGDALDLIESQLEPDQGTEPAPDPEQQADPDPEPDLDPESDPEPEPAPETRSQKRIRQLNDKYLQETQARAAIEQENETLRQQLAQIQAGSRVSDEPDPDFSKMDPGEVVAYLRQQIANDVRQQNPAPSAAQLKAEIKAEQTLDAALEDWGAVLTPEHRAAAIWDMVTNGREPDAVIGYCRPDLVRERMTLAEQRAHAGAIRGPSGSQRSAPAKRSQTAKPRDSWGQSEDDALDAIGGSFFGGK